MDSKIGGGSRRPSLVPTPEGEAPPKPGGPQPIPPGRPRLTTTPTTPAPVSSAQLSVGTPAKVSRADLEKWIASAPSNPNESRHNVYRAILDSGKPSASVMAALCRQVGDEHLVCSEFVAHVLDARANNRIDKAHCHQLLKSMLQAMGPVARHDVDVFVAAATRGFVAREGTREHHTRLREAMMDSLSTLGEAIGLQGNNLNLKSPRWGSKAWDRQNDEKRLLGHLHPDKLRADRAVNARAAIARTAWQSTGLRNEALKRFAAGLDLGSHGKSAHAQADAPAAVVGSVGDSGAPAPLRPSDSKSTPTPTPVSPPERTESTPPPQDPDSPQAEPDRKHTPPTQQTPHTPDTPHTSQTSDPSPSSAVVTRRAGRSHRTFSIPPQVRDFLRQVHAQMPSERPERDAGRMVQSRAAAIDRERKQFFNFLEALAAHLQQPQYRAQGRLIGWTEGTSVGDLSHASAQAWIEQNRELARKLFAMFQQMNGQASEDQAHAQIEGSPHDDGQDQQHGAANSVVVRMEPGVDHRSPPTLVDVLSAAEWHADAGVDAHWRREQLRQRDDKSDASYDPDFDGAPNIEFDPVDDDFADFMSSDSRHAAINKLLDETPHPPEFFSSVIEKLKDCQVELPTIIKDLNTCAALKLASRPAAATVTNYVKACAAVANWVAASPESEDYAALFTRQIQHAAELHGKYEVSGECIQHLAAEMAKANPPPPDATGNVASDLGLASSHVTPSPKDLKST